MPIFLVVSEDFYGGGSSFIKAFRSKSDADNYAESVNLECISIPFSFESPPGLSSLPIVFSEDWFGGGPEFIRIFASLSDAQKYSESCSPKLDVIACDIPLI